jgi:glutamine phosphoribosylpyrophosphate amidotransferase
MLVYREMGLVREVLNKATLVNLRMHAAIGPTCYSTAAGSYWENAQPAFKLNATGGGMAVAHNGNPTNTAALAGQLIPQESPASRPVQPRAASDTGVIAELLAREGDLSLEGAIVRTIARRVAFTEPVVPAAIGRGRGLRRAWVTGSYPIPAPDTATATLRPFVTTQPPTLPLPNPEPEVAR